MEQRTKVSSYLRKNPRYIRVAGKKPYTPFITRVRLFFRRLSIAFLLLVIVGSSYFITFTVGQLTMRMSDTPEQILSIAHAEEKTPPVLARIAKAESLTSHYCTDTLIRAKLCSPKEKGQVLVRVNKDGTLDVGKYQINTYHWGAQATALGLDVYDEKENERMALWIFENYGTEPWYASKKNW